MTPIREMDPDERIAAHAFPGRMRRCGELTGSDGSRAVAGAVYWIKRLISPMAEYCPPPDTVDTCSTT